MRENFGVLRIYPGGASRALEGPYTRWKAHREARLLRHMMHGRAPRKGVFVVDYDAELEAMKTREPSPPPYSLYPYGEEASKA